MRRIGMLILAAGAVLVLLLGAPQRDTRTEAQLQAAINRETVEGDLKGAIDQYKKLAQSRDQAVAVKALLRMGECYEKLGDTEARKAYEQVLSRFSNQPAAVAQARARLTALGGLSAQVSGVNMRQFFVGGGYGLFNVSADGRFAAATDEVNGAVVDLVTGKGWNITKYNPDGGEGYADTGVISRDGKKVAFWHDRGRGKNKSLVVVDVDSKAERTVYESKEDGPWCVPRDWSPDGKYIGVQLEVADRTGKGVTSYALVPADGGEPRILKSVEYVRHPYYRPRLLFSPDGRLVAFESLADKEGTQDDIFVVPIGGGPEWAVVSHPAQEQLVGWAPDGSILFLSNRTGEAGLYRIRTKDGKSVGEAEVLRPQMGNISLIGFAATGSLYYSQRGWPPSDAYIASMDFETGKLLGKPEPASQRLSGATTGLVWSPDGKMSACLHIYPDGRPPTILIQQESAGETRELHTGVVSAMSNLIWHSDGKSLLAMGTGGLFRIDLRTGETGLVWKRPIVLSSAFPSPDGRYVFSQDWWQKGPLVRSATATSDQKVILPAAGVTWGSYCFSPDGRKLSFIQAKSLYTVPAEGGTPQLVSNLDGEFAWRATAWTADGRYILLVAGSGGKGTLWAVPAGGGPPRRTELTFTGDGVISVHPDGKRLSYTVTGRGGGQEYWVLENFLPKAAK